MVGILRDREVITFDSGDISQIMAYRVTGKNKFRFQLYRGRPVKDLFASGEFSEEELVYFIVSLGRIQKKMREVRLRV